MTVIVYTQIDHIHRTSQALVRYRPRGGVRVDGGVEPDVLGVASLVGVLVRGGGFSDVGVLMDVGVLSEVCDLYGVVRRD